MPAYLEVLEGPSAGRRYAPGAAETTVGIVEHCEVALLPPGGNAAAQAVEVAVPFAAPRRRRLSAFGTGLSSGRRRGFHLASARAMLRIHVFDGRQRRIGPARARRPADAVGEEAMMGTRIAAALAVAALLLSAVALGEELAPAPAPGESPGARNPEAPQPGTAEAPGIGASTPQEALEQLQKAAQSGDLRKAASLFAEPFASLLAKTLAATETMAKAAGKLNEAVTSRLGAEAAKALRLERRMKPPTGTPFEGKIEMIDLKEEGDRATAKVKTTKKTGEVHEESIELEKGAGGWKILPPRRGDKTPMTEKDLKPEKNEERSHDGTGEREAERGRMREGGGTVA